MTHPKILLFVEGHSDVKAAPLLVRRVRNETFASESSEASVSILDRSWRVGNYINLLKEAGNESPSELEDQLLRAARQGVSGVIILMDGDVLPSRGNDPLCAPTTAREMARIAKRAGAGKTISVAVVFAMQEVESWLIAGANSLAGKPIDGRPGLNSQISLPTSDLEIAPRDAKKWLGRNMSAGYIATTDLAGFLKIVDLNQIRARKMRSFRRLENAVMEICRALVSGNHIATPQAEEIP